MDPLRLTSPRYYVLRVQVLRYEYGQEYQPHHDFFHDGFPDRGSGQRIATVLMYLCAFCLSLHSLCVQLAVAMCWNAFAALAQLQPQSAPLIASACLKLINIAVLFCHRTTPEEGGETVFPLGRPHVRGEGWSDCAKKCVLCRIEVCKSTLPCHAVISRGAS